MRPFLPSAVLTAIALATLPSLPQSANAATGVTRCQMPDGSNVYTNPAVGSCAAFGATPAPLSKALLERIELEQRKESASRGGAVPGPLSAVHSAALETPKAAPGTRGCANSPQQLAVNLQSAVALDDVNRLAESYHWNGMRNAEAQRIMLRLEQLASRRPVSVEYFAAGAGPLASGYGAANTSAYVGGVTGTLRARVAVGAGSQVLDFAVFRDKGCYLVSY